LVLAARKSAPVAVRKTEAGGENAVGIVEARAWDKTNFQAGELAGGVPEKEVISGLGRRRVIKSRP